MTVLSLHTVPFCSENLWPHWLLVVAGSQHLDRCPPTPPTVARTISRANFPFHQPGLFIGFGQWGARPHHTPLGILTGKCWSSWRSRWVSCLWPSCSPGPGVPPQEWREGEVRKRTCADFLFRFCFLDFGNFVKLTGKTSTWFPCSGTFGTRGSYLGLPSMLNCSRT